jgi:hypothetical protein
LRRACPIGALEPESGSSNATLAGIGGGAGWAASGGVGSAGGGVGLACGGGAG